MLLENVGCSTFNPFRIVVLFSLLVAQGQAVTLHCCGAPRSGRFHHSPLGGHRPHASISNQLHLSGQYYNICLFLCLPFNSYVIGTVPPTAGE